MLPLVRIAGLPIEVWLKLPFAAAILHVIFRWRKFGEDAFTWNHEYFKCACTTGFIIAAIAYIASLLPAAWHVGLVWLATFIVTLFVLSYSFSEEWLNATILSIFIVLLGVLAMPVPRIIRRVGLGVADTPTKHEFNPVTDIGISFWTCQMVGRKFPIKNHQHTVAKMQALVMFKYHFCRHLMIKRLLANKQNKSSNLT